MATALTKGVHEGISAVHIRIAELGSSTADAAEEKVCPCAPIVCRRDRCFCFFGVV